MILVGAELGPVSIRLQFLIALDMIRAGAASRSAPIAPSFRRGFPNFLQSVTAHPSSDAPLRRLTPHVPARHPYDNAKAENFMKTLKVEAVYGAVRLLLDDNRTHAYFRPSDQVANLDFDQVTAA